MNRLLHTMLAYAALAAALSFVAPFVQAQDIPIGGDTVRKNEFGPQGGMCMDACGPSCPDTCEQEPIRRCHEERANVIETGTRYTCGTHSACSIHDTCLENCEVLWERRSVGNEDADEFIATVDFVFGECQKRCHHDALATATKIGGSRAAGVEIVTSWARGRGPYEGSGVWEYTKPSKDADELTTSCSMCEKCDDGRCVRTAECPDCTSCGDVHIATLDGLRYSLQSVGEFVLAESQDRSFVLQSRAAQLGESRVSTNRAAVMLVDRDRVGVYLQPDRVVRINGEPADIAPGDTVTLPNGGRIERRGRQQLRIYWQDGTLVVISGFAHSAMHIGVHASDALRGRLRGLAGDADGDPGNDLRLRTGEPLIDRSFESLHTVFADSWRISQAESLFDYAAGETTDTYTDLNFPSSEATLKDLDEATRTWAEIVCRQAGITDTRILRDCILDVGLSGDVAFATSHAIASPPKAVAEVGDEHLVNPAGAGLSAPSVTGSGSSIDVGWAGEPYAGDYLAVAVPEARAGTHLRWVYASRGLPARLTVPDVPGEYEVRYVGGKTAAVLARRPLTVTASEAELEFAAEATSGGPLAVEWVGPDNRGDFISLAPPDAPGGSYETYRYTRDGSPLTLHAPDAAGDYEVRYVQGQSKTVLAQRALRVVPVQATVEAVATVGSGGDLEVAWTGPDNRGDFISLARPDAPGGSYETYRYTRSGSPLTLHAPDAAGDYELRYVQGQSKTVLAQRALRVVPVQATIETVTTVGSGGGLEVAWTGPDNRRDFISLARPDAPGSSYETYLYTRSGSPLTLHAPDAVGDYEVRYVQGQSQTILARQALDVTPVDASLRAPDTVPPGADVEIEWSGPDNRGDYLSLARPDAPGGSYETYRYARSGSPLTLKAPEEPGEYEVRYVQGQSKSVLAREKLNVR